MTRTAISPRLATSTRWSAATAGSALGIDRRRAPARTRPPRRSRRGSTSRRPATGAATWFMSFITSTIATVSPAATRPPTSTNGGAPGDGARQNRPTDGDSTTVPVPGAASPAAAGAGRGGGGGAGAGAPAGDRRGGGRGRRRGGAARRRGGRRRGARPGSPGARRAGVSGPIETVISCQSLRSKASRSAFMARSFNSMLSLPFVSGRVSVAPAGSGPPSTPSARAVVPPTPGAPTRPPTGDHAGHGLRAERPLQGLLRAPRPPSWTSASIPPRRSSRSSCARRRPARRPAGHGGAQGGGAPPRAVEPLPPRPRVRPRPDATSSTRRWPRSSAAARSRPEACNCTAPDTGQHGGADAVRHATSRRSAGCARCSTARSARRSR